ncbi:MaoC family dehydratase [Aeromicrobium sp. 9AM]|uniref:MaoC family dehydratase n=1 Tax=Aeromicrobium sp. 9AM TaxID=2653126 RepID=UPI0012F45BF9|nr:MaoC family dehydratase [Aeromicrobium sp. 9AM]VXB09286.1 Acyl dehydratase [Aeromicrobium sp. 9AM]
MNAQLDPTKREPFYFEDYAAGQKFVSRGRTVTDADIRLHVGSTGADHPNHTDDDYSSKHPVLKGVCAHGLLVLGIVDGFITDELPKFMGPSMNYGHEKVRYIAPVYTGDTIHAEIEITDCRDKDDQWGLLELAVNAVNQNGVTVLFDQHILIVQKRAAAGSGPSQG